jgi:hypothetical protein
LGHCSDSRACLERLKDRFWVNVPHYPSFVSQEVDIKQVLMDRTIYFVDAPDWPPGIITSLLLDKILEKRAKKIPMLQRFEKSFEIKFGNEIRLLKIIDSPLYPIYSIKIIPQKL